MSTGDQPLQSEECSVGDTEKVTEGIQRESGSGANTSPSSGMRNALLSFHGTRKYVGLFLQESPAMWSTTRRWVLDLVV